MPEVRRSRKPPPDEWELIEPTLNELDQKMREGESKVSSCRRDSVLFIRFYFRSKAS